MAPVALDVQPSLTPEGWLQTQVAQHGLDASVGYLALVPGSDEQLAQRSGGNVRPLWQEEDPLETRHRNVVIGFVAGEGSGPEQRAASLFGSGDEQMRAVRDGEGQVRAALGQLEAALEG